MTQVLAGLATIRAADIADVLLVALLLWGGLVWLRKSRARLALLGLGYLAFVYLIARALRLQLTAWMLQGFFAIFVIVLVVVFQEELRRLFEHLAMWGLRRRPQAISGQAIDVVAGAVRELAECRIGALIVLAGRDPLDRHLEGGTVIDGKLSESLLLSLFDPSSPGHDGAAVLDGDRLKAFGVHLPLSADHGQIGSRGTRHAAALGLAERADALAIVVSEERGLVSVAHEGVLRTLSGLSDLTKRLEVFQAGLAPARGEERFSFSLLARHWRSALLALGVAMFLWLGLVAGAVTVEETRVVPVIVTNLPAQYALVAVEPSEVEVSLSGRRRALLFTERAALKVELDGFLVGLGRRTFEISPSEVRRPSALAVVSIKPTQVRLSVKVTTD